MKSEQKYVQDIAEVRSMMERSSKFMSLSGLAGIMAGLYALAGVSTAYTAFSFNPKVFVYESTPENLLNLILLGAAILVLAIGTASLLSYNKATKRREKFWNSTAKRVVVNMAVPLITGGLLLLIFIAKGLLGLLAPCTLIFYGLALFNTSKFTYDAIRSLGLIQIALGLISAYFVEYALLCWAIGFGIVHIVYGIYLHYRYER